MAGFNWHNSGYVSRTNWIIRGFETPFGTDICPKRPLFATELRGFRNAKVGSSILLVSTTNPKAAGSPAAFFLPNGAYGRGLVRKAVDWPWAANAKGAKISKHIVESHGKNVDDAINGARMSKDAHGGVHTSAYYRDLERDLIAANSKSRPGSAILQVLRDYLSSLQGLLLWGIGQHRGKWLPTRGGNATDDALRVCVATSLRRTFRWRNRGADANHYTELSVAIRNLMPAHRRGAKRTGPTRRRHMCLGNAGID